RRDRSSKCRLAMIHVSNRPDIYMWFASLKFTLSHTFLPRFNTTSTNSTPYSFILARQSKTHCAYQKKYMVPMARIELAASPLPRECSTTELHGQTTLMRTPF